MKKILLASAFALFGLANAQENSVKVNPFALLGGTDLVSYERAIGGASTVGVGVGIGGFKIADYKYSNVGGSVFYRYYFGGTPLKGWYGLGGLSYSNGKAKYNKSIFGEDLKFEHKYNSFGGNVRAGYQWVWDSGFTLDLNAGISYSSFNYKTNDTVEEIVGLKSSGILPAVGVALGYSF